MCSFLILNWIAQNIDYLNYFIKFRGPDLTNIYNYENFMFLHNLLHLTGEVTAQPFKDDDNKIICSFNGEIYNYKYFGDYESDVYSIVESYKRYGDDFVSQLDGEFALCLFDFKKNRFIISTDVFSTKPLWYSIDNGKLGISSYESALKRAGLNNRIKLNPNTTLIFNISDFKLVRESRVFNFDLNNQHKNTYEDWCKAFINSIKKRTDNSIYDVFVCLSSGYDSGAIACGLNVIEDKKYLTYTILGDETEDIINKRFEVNNKITNNNNNIVDFTKTEFAEIKNYIKEHAEEFKLNPLTIDVDKYVTDDNAATGMSKICKIAFSKNQRIYLSGSGADEIHSDYGKYGEKIFNHSCFGGKWPDDLNTILNNDPKVDMVWKSFYHGTQKDYLAKEEIISGLFGIEGRYPYLDKYVVQEFLWLKTDLKNNLYKAPIDYFMTKYNYPFEKETKKGFSPDKNLKD